MNSKFKVKLKQVDKTWISITLSHDGQEIELGASEIACSPITEIIGAIENSCIYNEASQAVLDAEGVIFKVSFAPSGSDVVITSSYITESPSLTMPGNYSKKEEIELKVTISKINALQSFWRGLKEYFAKEQLEMNDLMLIESKVKLDKNLTR